MLNSFKFKIRTNIRFGVGMSNELGNEIKGLGFSKIAAIIDQGVFEHPLTFQYSPR